MKKVIKILLSSSLMAWFGAIMMKGSLDILKLILPIELVGIIMAPLVIIYLFVSSLISEKILEWIKTYNHATSKKQIKI